MLAHKNMPLIFSLFSDAQDYLYEMYSLESSSIYRQSPSPGASPLKWEGGVTMCTSTLPTHPPITQPGKKKSLGTAQKIIRSRPSTFSFWPSRQNDANRISFPLVGLVFFFFSGCAVPRLEFCSNLPILNYKKNTLFTQPAAHHHRPPWRRTRLSGKSLTSNSVLSS